MKKVLLLINILFVFLLSCCFDDKGNYNYSDVGQIQIGGFEDSYQKILLEDTLKIFPEIKVDPDDYDFVWYIYGLRSKKIDTLTLEKDLIFPVKDIKAETYTLTFQAIQKSNQLKSFKTTTFTVSTHYSDGWLIMKERDGKTDVDMYSDTGKELLNLMERTHGQSLKGKPKFINFYFDYLLDKNEAGEQIPVRTFLFATDQDMKALNASDLSILGEFDELFFLPPEKCAPNRFYVGRFDVFLINDNRLLGMPLRGGLTNKMYEFTTKDYKFFDMVAGTPLGIYLYELSENTIFSLMWGNLTPQATNLTPQATNLNPSIQPFHAYTVGGAPNFLCRHEEYPDSLYVIKLNEIDTLGKDLIISKSDVISHHQQADILYHGLKNKLYLFKVPARENIEIYDFKDENITFIAHVNSPLSKDNLVVATYKENKYKVYIFELLEQSIKQNSSPVIMEGQGRAEYVFYQSSEYGLMLPPSLY